MQIPVIDLAEIHGEKRSKTMALLHEACEKWGFFQVDSPGIDKKLMEKVKQLVNSYYDENLKENFYESEIVKSLKNNENTSNMDWESTFFIWHHPKSNIKEIQNISEELRACERTREHTDAGGIIIMLQDDQVPGLEFLKDEEWVHVPPSRNNTIFVNTGDQVEVLSSGRYKSALHRIMTEKNGSRLSIATFYNPAGDALISPAPKLLYPNHYSFQDYLKLYSTTKFSEKGLGFESMKTMANGHHNLHV
ncbi:hypothetical protein REPUB_Repub18cG0107200 [Reevesia pubescens]